MIGVMLAWVVSSVITIGTNGDINSAIERVAKANGGKVVVTKGVHEQKGPIRFKSGVELNFEDGAEIVFSDKPEDYLPAVHTTWEGVECYNYSPLVYAYGCTNIAITGSGTFRPKMDGWRKWFARPKEHMDFTAELYRWCSELTPMEARQATAIPGSNARPQLIQINRCKNVTLRDFRIRESPFWTIHLYLSDDIEVAGLDVYAHGHNNDGVDVDMCRRVKIHDCTFNQGDDAIVIKAGRNQDAWRLNRPTEDVEVWNCTVIDGHVLLGVGSELSGGVKNVYMHDCTMKGNVYNVFYVKTNERRGGVVENIRMRNCRVAGGAKTKSVVGVETDVLYQWARFKTYEVRPTIIRNLTVEDVHCDEAKHLLYLKGDKRAPIENVTLKNVTCGHITGEPIVVENATWVNKTGDF